MAAATGKSALWQAADEPDDLGPLLLDTHIWVWLLDGDTTRVHPTVPPMLQRAAAGGNLVVSDISFWEIGLKTAKGKLKFSVDATVWLRQAERAPGIVYVPLDRSVLIQSTRLPGDARGDPADRMLIATAQLRGMSLVTVDAEIITYAASEPGIPVCDARP